MNLVEETQAVIEAQQKEINRLSRHLSELIDMHTDLANAWSAEVYTFGGHLWLATEDGQAWLNGEGKERWTEVKAANEDVVRHIKICIEERQDHVNHKRWLEYSLIMIRAMQE